MEPGPTPPHERSWRHPAEVAAEERDLVRSERLTSPVRALAIVSGTLGLVMLAVVLVAVTPGSYIVSTLSATTLPSLRQEAATEALPDLLAFGLRAPLGSDDHPAGPQLADPLVTPIAPGDLAVVARSALVPTSVPTSGTIIRLRLEEGQAVDGVVELVTDDLVIVTIDGKAPGHRIAAQRPNEHDLVVVLTDPPMSLTVDQLADVGSGVAPGTPVLDRYGSLIGVLGPDGIIDVSRPIVLATTDG